MEIKREEKEPAVSLVVAVLPSEEVRRQAIEMSEFLGSLFPTEFVLNESNNLPHITIYQARFLGRNLSNILDAVRILPNLAPISLSLGNISIDYDTFVWWNAQKTEEVLDLQREIIERINPLREGMIPSVLATLTNVPLEEQENIRVYGYANVGDFSYRPHVTIVVSF